MTRRLLFYVHFNRYDQLSDHVIYQLAKLEPLFEKIVLISNSQISQEDLSKLHYDKFVQRQNSGFDFSAWQEGVNAVGFDEIGQYDSVTFMNDTCFGPLYEMQPYYEKFEAEGVDFWGITNHRKTKEIKEHIQSYYVVYHQNVLQSKIFQSFWQNVDVMDDVQDVIENYETALTSELVSVGYRYQTILDTLRLSTVGMLHPDFSFWNPTVILENKVPFLKVKAVQSFKDMTPLVLNELRNKSDYPLQLIYSHMSKYVEYPDEKYLLANSYIKNQDIKTSFDGPVAIHLHVFYTDLLTDFFEQFNRYN